MKWNLNLTLVSIGKRYSLNITSKSEKNNMIDEKKITEAAIQNADKYNPFRSTLDREEVCRASFKDGIEWLQSALWHNASEKPQGLAAIL